MTRKARYRHSERGIAIVEFAVAAPILLLLLLATAELGRMLSQYNTLNKSVRDGARYLATNALSGTTWVVVITPTVQTATINLVVTGNTAGTGSALLPSLSASNVTVTGLANGYVSVAATYAYVPMIGSNLPTFGLSAPINVAVNLTATQVMRPL